MCLCVCVCVCMSMLLSQFIPPSPSPAVSTVCSLCLHLCSFPVAQQNPTQHCKGIILQLKKNNHPYKQQTSCLPLYIYIYFPTAPFINKQKYSLKK